MGALLNSVTPLPFNLETNIFLSFTSQVLSMGCFLLSNIWPHRNQNRPDWYLQYKAHKKSIKKPACSLKMEWKKLKARFGRGKKTGKEFYRCKEAQEKGAGGHVTAERKDELDRQQFELPSATIQPNSTKVVTNTPSSTPSSKSQQPENTKTMNHLPPPTTSIPWRQDGKIRACIAYLEIIQRTPDNFFDANNTRSNNLQKEWTRILDKLDKEIEDEIVAKLRRGSEFEGACQAVGELRESMRESDPGVVTLEVMDGFVEELDGIRKRYV